MATKLNDPAFVDSIDSNQTPRLLAKFKEQFSDQLATIEVIERVVLYDTGEHSLEFVHV